MLLDARFDLAHALQRLIPAPFEFIRHQPILRIGRVELLLCAPRFLPASLDRTLVQQVELALVEAALESEQQAIIALAGVAPRNANGPQ